MSRPRKSSTSTTKATRLRAALDEQITDIDDILAAIFDANERLDAGLISVSHAGKLARNFQTALGYIGREVEIARATGRTKKTIERWFKRVGASEVSAAVNPDPSPLVLELQRKRRPRANA